MSDSPTLDKLETVPKGLVVIVYGDGTPTLPERPDHRPVEVGRPDHPAGEAGGGAEVGTDGGKRVRGRKRHIVTDTLGLLLVVLVTAANRDDGAVAPEVLTELHADEFPRLSVLWADKKYRNDGLDAWLAAQS